MKIFGIGFHKTGTTTLGSCLEKLEYKVAGPKTHLAKQLDKGDFDEFWKITTKHDAFQDNPWPLFYKELDQKYPNSKFILTIREDEKWIKSVKKYFGKKPTFMREYIYGEAYPVGNESLYLERYKRHNREVLDYFKDRENDLLVVNWEKGDGWEEICDFLGKEVPHKEFPHANRNKKNRKNNRLRKAKYWIKHRLKLY